MPCQTAAIARMNTFSPIVVVPAPIASVKRVEHEHRARKNDEQSVLQGIRQAPWRDTSQDPFVTLHEKV